MCFATEFGTSNYAILHMIRIKTNASVIQVMLLIQIKEDLVQFPWHCLTNETYEF